jgi:hypothetical protein
MNQPRITIIQACPGFLSVAYLLVSLTEYRFENLLFFFPLKREDREAYQVFDSGLRDTICKYILFKRTPAQWSPSLHHSTEKVEKSF